MKLPLGVADAAQRHAQSLPVTAAAVKPARSMPYGKSGGNRLMEVAAESIGVIGIKPLGFANVATENRMPEHGKPAVAMAMTTRPSDTLLHFNSAEVVVAYDLPKVQTRII